MKTLAFLALFFTAVTVHGQAPQPTPPPPFRLNFQVAYTGSKTHPDLAAMIYKSLRALPGVGIVDRDPDAVLIINENADSKDYACSLTILTPQTPFLRFQLQSAMDSYQADQRVREGIGETTDKNSKIISTWPAMLATSIQTLTPMFTYEGGIISINPSPKEALMLAIKSLDGGFVEKQRREHDYQLTHPVTVEPFHFSPVAANSTPKPQPTETPRPWTPPSRDFQLTAPAETPTPLLPDYFPAKR